jgi:NAD+ synthase
LKAKPTDGLWEDGRTDEEQIGNTYEELEWAMNILDNFDDKRLEIISNYINLNKMWKKMHFKLPF